jgi:hypothetical protein
MLHSGETLERGRDDRARRTSLRIGNEADAARVELAVVRHGEPPGVGSRLVRAGALIAGRPTGDVRASPLKQRAGVVALDPDKVCERRPYPELA